MTTHEFSLYRDGMPDLAVVRANFPEHGHGKISHQTQLGDHFEFNIVRTASGYEALIEVQPPYAGVADNYHATHRLPANGGGKKVCFKNPPQDLPMTVTLTMWWAECTSRYIRDGRAWS